MLSLFLNEPVLIIRFSLEGGECASLSYNQFQFFLIVNKMFFENLKRFCILILSYVDVVEKSDNYAIPLFN